MYIVLAKSRFTMRTLRRCRKRLRDRGILKLLPQGLPEDPVERTEHAWQTIGLSYYMDVVDEIKQRSFEPQSLRESIFEDVPEAEMLASSEVSKEIDKYCEILKGLPLDCPLTVEHDPLSMSEQGGQASQVAQDQDPISEFITTWKASKFDMAIFDDYKHGNWVAFQLTRGHVLTRSALAKYRHILHDLNELGIIPIISNIISYMDRVVMVVLVPNDISPTRPFEPHSGMEVSYNSDHVSGANLRDPVQDSEMRQQQMTFSDQDTGYTYQIDDFVDDVRKSRDERIAAYQDFLRRPIKLNAYKWGVGTSLVADINPWDDYFGNNTRINNRISFFNLLRGKLCVKAVISGTGFHYGRLLLSYLPLHRYDQMSATAAPIDETLVQLSQLPHVFLNPTTQQGGSMCLPYFWHWDYTQITNRTWVDLGSLYLRSLGPLKHANDGTDDVTVTFFAWMEDVEVSIPTSVESANLQPQSGEEVDEANATGAISGPASKISGITSMLSSVPVIGPYASATSKVAAGVAMAAKAMGMSRPPVTKNVEPYKPESLSSFALTTVPDRSAKLTVDDKQELSIDPRISGLGGDDPMDILAIAKKESFYTSFIWPKAANVNTDLFEVRVQPTIWAEPVANDIRLTAVGYASLPFTYWTGTLKFRFQIVASAYHKGRLRVVYDPNWVDPASDVNGGDMITNYTHIIDMANTTDFTIAVTQGQTTSLLQHFYPGEEVVASLYHGHDGITPPAPYISKPRFVSNGVLGITVLNELTTPNSVVNNDVRVNCYVSAGDDFQVFAPNDYIKNLAVQNNTGVSPQSGFESDFEPHSGEMKADKIDDNQVDMPLQSAAKEMGAATVSPRLNEIYTGECIKSFRNLIKRFNLYTVIPLDGGGAVAGTLTKTQWRSPAYPCYRGPGFGNPINANADFNTVNMTWVHYVTLAFQGARGAMRWKFIPITTEASPVVLSVERGDTRLKDPYINRETSQVIATGTGTAAATFMYDQVAGADTIENMTLLAGGIATHSSVNSALEVEIPYLHNFRFRPGKWGAMNVRSLDFMGLESTVDLQALNVHTSGENVILSYLAAGEDYTTYFFTGCPPLEYRPVSIPGP